MSNGRVTLERRWTVLGEHPINFDVVIGVLKLFQCADEQKETFDGYELNDSS